MKVYIPSYNRPETITTHLLFSDYCIIVHNQEQKNEYVKNKTIDPSRIVVSETPCGASINRQWAMHNIIPYGEWYVMADDNITSINAVEKDFYMNEYNNVQDTSVKWREIYNVKCDEQRFFEVVKDTIAEAEKHGYHHAGFALTDNPFFNGVKFKHIGYVIGKLMVSRNLHTKTANELFGYAEGNVLEDMTATAENLLRWGGIVMNSYVKPVAKHYMAGGIGTYEERLPRKIISCRNLMARYKGLFTYKEEDKSDVRISIRNKERLLTWRSIMKQGLAENYPYHGLDMDKPMQYESQIKNKQSNQQSLF